MNQANPYPYPYPNIQCPPSATSGKLDDLGLLTYGTFTTYHQGDSCDYTWHHTANEVE